MQIVNKKEMWRMPICLFVLPLEYGWSTLKLRGQGPLVQRGRRYLSATSFGVICILGRTSYGLSWVACGTGNCGQRAWDTLLRTCQAYKEYIYFHINTTNIPGTTLLFTNVCFIQRFSTCISLLTFYIFKVSTNKK